MHEDDDGEPSALPMDVAAGIGEPGWNSVRKGCQVEVKFFTTPLSQPSGQLVSTNYPLRSAWIK